MQKKFWKKSNPRIFFIRMVQSKFRDIILLSMAVMRERLRWLGHALWKMDDRLPKIVIFGRPSRAKQKAGHLRVGWEIS